MSNANPRLATATLTLALGLAACSGRTGAPAPAGTPHPAPAASAARAPAAAATRAAPARASTAFRVVAVTLGSAVDDAQRITTAATRFAPSTATLYAGVASTGAAADTTLTARWNYLEGKGQLVTSVSQRLASTGPAYTTFTVHNPDLWPEGDYDVEILVDGKPAQSVAFTIAR